MIWPARPLTMPSESIVIRLPLRLM
jgi:hypothetical protein